MTEFVYLGLLLAIVTNLYTAFRRYSGQFQRVDSLVMEEASTKGLRIKSLSYPNFREWSDAPFKKEIRVGSVGLEGFPFNREFYRIAKCREVHTGAEKEYWIRVTDNLRKHALISEWKEQDFG